MQQIKSLEQMTNEELEDLLDSGVISPAVAKKIEKLLTKREHPQQTSPIHEEREEEEA